MCCRITNGGCIRRVARLSTKRFGIFETAEGISPQATSSQNELEARLLSALGSVATKAVVPWEQAAKYLALAFLPPVGVVGALISWRLASSRFRTSSDSTSLPCELGGRRAMKLARKPITQPAKLGIPLTRQPPSIANLKVVWGTGKALNRADEHRIWSCVGRLVGTADGR